MTQKDVIVIDWLGRSLVTKSFLFLLFRLFLFPDSQFSLFSSCFLFLSRGINVLDQKSELTKVLEKRQAAARMKEREQAEGLIKLQRKSSFERKLEEQAIKIMNAENQVKNQSDDHHNNNSKGSHDPEAEFLRIHAKIYEKKQLASS